MFWWAVFALVVCVEAGPITIISSVNKNHGQKNNADVFDASRRNGLSSFEEENGFNRNNEVKIIKGQDSGKFDEESNDHKDRVNEENYQDEKFRKNAGVDSKEFGNKQKHHKGHHKSGFHNSYHNDESGRTFGDFSNHRQKAEDRNANHYANDREKHRNYNNGEAFNQDQGQNRQYNQRKYFDDREEAARNNGRNNFDVGRDYHQEEFVERPYYNERYVPEEDYYYDGPQQHPIRNPLPPTRTITVYEDPRYIDRRYDHRPAYDHDDIHLDFRRPPRYNSRIPYDDYY
ncbi:unnamed protein product [Brassicogethes aeneus]|uniref:Uncharacterized protein n=1 Tax=Brassicogethes aeneus TaxID=1431903 RepID=A0A9P0FMM2_BRAAE|nr:unnamed protein product [Brassicogethes aeneus]